MLTQMHSFRWALLVSALILCSADSAQSEWQAFSGANEIGDGQVNTIVIDSRNDLWFGTDTGIRRYSGIQWQQYPEVPYRITAMLEDSRGTIWAGTASDGLYLFDGARWQKSDPDPDEISIDAIKVMLEDSSGDLWVGSSQGLFHYNSVEWISLGPSDGVESILEGRTGRLWVGYKHEGLVSYEADLPTTRVETFEEVNVLMEARDGVVWAGGTDGFLYQCNETTCNPSALELGREDVRSLLQDQLGLIWVGTQSGLWRQDGKGDWASLRERLLSSRVEILHEDSRGNIWMASKTATGVNRYDGLRWTGYEQKPGELGHDKVSAIASDSSGNIWFGGTSSVTRHDNVNWTTYLTELAPDSSVSAILYDRQDRIWIGADSSLVVFEDGDWRHQPIDLEGKVRSIYEDPDGSIWIGTDNGACRFENNSCKTELTGHAVYAILRDTAGTLWFGTNSSGVVRCTESSCDTLRADDSGLTSDQVRSILQDRDGAIWFCTDVRSPDNGGVSSYDGATWRVILDGTSTTDVIEATSGDLWFATNDGTIVYDGNSTSVLDPTGVISIKEDPEGNIWTGTDGPMARRFDGEQWLTFGSSDGLGGSSVQAIETDSLGNLWFGTAEGGVSVFEPDRARPGTRFVDVPPPLTFRSTQTITFRPAFGEESVSFEASLDDDDWSPTSGGFWSGPNLPDGVHSLRIRAGDDFGNLEEPPATTTFEIDATAPGPLITSPRPGDPVQGQIAISGHAADFRFQSFRIEVLSLGTGELFTLQESFLPIESGVLYEWETSELADGNYEVHLSVEDTLGLIGRDQIVITIDNLEPHVFQTSPARIGAADGGHVYTTEREAHLLIPPGAFTEDVIVTIAQLDWPEGDTLTTDGARRVSAGFSIGWDGADLNKTALFDLELNGSEPGEGTTDESTSISIYRKDPESANEWTRLGGTHESEVERIFVPLEDAGHYALFRGSDPTPDTGDLGVLSISPRIYSKENEAFAGSNVGIAFSLARSATVTVRIFNRAGRLVREVERGLSLAPGQNLIQWDGRSDSGNVVRSGLYMITVEALGRTRTQTVAVVQ